MKPRYGDAGDRIPVKTGDRWRIGKHEFVCGDWETQITEYPFPENPDLIYVDPPWGQGNARSFQTKNGTTRKIDYWDSFLPALMEQFRAGRGPIFMEQGYNWFPQTVSDMEINGFLLLRNWKITYYGKNPCILMQFSSMEYPSDVIEGLDLAGMDDRDTPTEVMKFMPKNTIVFDPCTGQGATPVAAEKAGCIARGIELNPRRLAVTLDKLQRITGNEPVRIGTI